MAPGLEINAVRIAQARLAMPKENGRPVSQAKFAEKLGIHWVTVSNLERGKTKPSGETLAAICRVTGKPVEWFTGAAQEVQAPGADPFARALTEMLVLALERADAPTRSRVRAAIGAT
jgi:transcriptional regulator with XRE-family HTH domain